MLPGICATPTYITQIVYTTSTTNQLNRHCLREPIIEIAQATDMLIAAVLAHRNGNCMLAKELILLANMGEIREWSNSLWGKSSPYVQYRGIPSAEHYLTKSEPHTVRMPTLAQRRHLHDIDGYHCRFCGVPVMRKEVRQWFVAAYPSVAIWGRTHGTQHAAFQILWAQYDHVAPHARGGDNNLENIIVTCAPCNFGRMSHTLEELNLLDPRTRELKRVKWDGFEGVLL